MIKRIPSRVRHAMGRLDINSYDKREAVYWNVSEDFERFKKEIYSYVKSLFPDSSKTKTFTPSRRPHLVIMNSSEDVIFLTIFLERDDENDEFIEIDDENGKIILTVRISLHRGDGKELIATKKFDYKWEINKYGRRNWDVVKKELIAWVDNQLSRLKDF